MRGAMVSVVDGLDQYLRVLTRIDGLVDAKLHDLLNGRRLPIIDRRPTMPERLQGLCDHYPGVVRPEHISAIYLLAAWRNTFVHGDKRASLSNALKKRIKSAAKFFAREQGGADIVGALSRFEQGSAPELSDLATLFTSAHRLITTIDEYLLHIQSGSAYAIALMRYIIQAAENPSEFLEAAFYHGGARSAGRAHTLFLHNGANHASHARLASAPSITRVQLRAIFGIGRIRASELFDIPRASTNTASKKGEGKVRVSRVR